MDPLQNPQNQSPQPVPSSPQPFTDVTPTSPAPTPAPQPAQPAVSPTPVPPPTVPPVAPAPQAPVSTQNSYTPLSTPPPEPVPSPVAPTAPAPRLAPMPTASNTPNIAPAGMVPPVPPKGGSLKKVLIASIVGIVLLGGTALAGYFGWYLPNQPTAVWATGLDQSGELVDSLISENTTNENIQNLTKVDLSGSAEVKADGTTFKGTFASQYDDRNSDTATSVTLSDPSGQSKTIEVNLLSQLVEGSTFPNVYFMVNGITSLGLEGALPGVSAYEGKWISIESTFLEEIAKQSETEETKQPDITAEDIAEVARIFSKTTREYVLTGDTQKSVLVMKDFVADEPLANGMNTYHYTVSFHKENTKAFCRAMTERLYGSKAAGKLSEAGYIELPKDKDEVLKSCDEDLEREYSPDETFDLWMDKDRKIIHKVRFSEPEKKDTYVEVGQNYQGGDDFPMFVNFKDAEDNSNGKITITTNTKAQSTKAELEYTDGGESGFAVKAGFDLKPYEGDVTVNAPSGAVPIQEVFEKLFGSQIEPLLSQI